MESCSLKALHQHQLADNWEMIVVWSNWKTRCIGAETHAKAKRNSLIHFFVVQRSTLIFVNVFFHIFFLLKLSVYS